MLKVPVCWTEDGSLSCSTSVWLFRKRSVFRHCPHLIPLQEEEKGIFPYTYYRQLLSCLILYRKLQTTVNNHNLTPSRVCHKTQAPSKAKFIQVTSLTLFICSAIFKKIHNVSYEFPRERRGNPSATSASSHHRQ
jgi:hypothetical protein